MTNLVTKFSWPDWFTFDFDCNMCIFIFYFLGLQLSLYAHWYYFTCNFVCFWLQFSYVVVLDRVDECLNDVCVCNLNSVAPSLVSKRVKNKDWWSYLGLTT